jgi:hypothetical protein
MTKYGTGQFKVSQKQSYLGMEIEITSTGMSISMSAYVSELIEEAQEKGKVLVNYDSPGTKETFIMKEGVDLVKERERKYFHSTVAKLIYLAKRA